MKHLHGALFVPLLALVSACATTGENPNLAYNLYATVQVETELYIDSSGPSIDRFINPDLQEVPDLRTGLGTGIVVAIEDEIAYVLTNNHVIDGAERIRVVNNDGYEGPGTLVHVDERKDLALIQMEIPQGMRLEAIVRGDSDTLEVGDPVYSIGSPFGYQSSVSRGIISALGRRGGPGYNLNSFIQTDAAINRGNSGGPLFDANGNWVGVNTWITTQTGGSIGIGFSIPVNTVVVFVDDVLADGDIDTPWLGVQFASVGSSRRPAVMVANVYTNSPAWTMGIRPGQQLLSINGRPILNERDVEWYMADAPMDGDLEVLVGSGGDTAPVLLKALPVPRPAIPELSQWTTQLWPGISVGLDDEDRVVLRGVPQLAPSYALGLRSGDRLLKVNGQGITSLEQYYRALENIEAGALFFTIERDSQIIEYEVPLDQD